MIGITTFTRQWRSTRHGKSPLPYRRVHAEHKTIYDKDEIWMRLIAPTAFKGTMSPLEAARHIATENDKLLPLSDGGDGFVECLHYTLDGSFQNYETENPFGEFQKVPVLHLPDGTIAIESAKVIGLAGLKEKNPLRANSAGLGRLLSSFQSSHRIWIGLGGSATVDGGKDWPPVVLPPTIVFCDVRTDVSDAAELFGPQKGARPEDIPFLTKRLMDLNLPGGPFTGAAGGLGAKLLSFGARLVSGADEFLRVTEFDERCRGCDTVVTGEGRLDSTTLEGKLPYVVALRARQLGLKVFGHFGCKGEGWERAALLFDEIFFERET